MRAVLCVSLCNCGHSLKAEDDEGLVVAALEHMRLRRPAAPVDEAKVREIVATRTYDGEYVVVVYPGGYGPEREFGLGPYPGRGDHWTWCAEEISDNGIPQESKGRST